MDDLINQINSAIECKLYYSALFMTLTIPDICSAIQSENNITSGLEYKKWSEKYLTQIDNRYSADGQLTPDRLYNIRCSLLHQGQTNDEDTKKNRIGEFKRMLFFEPDTHGFNSLSSLHCTMVGSKSSEKSLLINIITFCNDMIKAVTLWQIDMKTDKFYDINIKKLIKRYPKGVPPIIGSPVIG